MPLRELANPLPGNQVEIAIVTPGPTQAEIVVPRGMLVDSQGRLFETREEVRRIPVGQGQPIMVPVMPVVSAPQVDISEIQERRFALLGRQTWPDPNCPLDLSGTKWGIVERWRPLTRQKAREGLLRLLTRRMETQPRTAHERVYGDGDLF